jgi:hypothetical protein
MEAGNFRLSQPCLPGGSKGFLGGSRKWMKPMGGNSRSGMVTIRMGMSGSASFQGEDVLVGCAGLVLVACEYVGASKLQMRQCAYGIAENDPSMVENFLEFRAGFGALMRG